MLEFQERPHSRLNPLTGEWVLVSPQRTLRPWQGEVEHPNEPAAVTYRSLLLSLSGQSAGRRESQP